MKTAFFDRDGTIAKDYPDEEWSGIKTPVLIPYAIEVLQYLRSVGYQIIIITNQYLIGEGFITQTQYDAYHEKLLSQLKNAGISILDAFYCPHARTDGCDCKKPGTGLIRQALQKYPNIDLTSSFVVGDSLCDMQMAEKLQIEAYGIGIEYSYKKFIKVKDMKDLLYILKTKGSDTTGDRREEGQQNSPSGL